MSRNLKEIFALFRCRTSVPTQNARCIDRWLEDHHSTGWTMHRNWQHCHLHGIPTPQTRIMPTVRKTSELFYHRLFTKKHFALCNRFQIIIGDLDAQVSLRMLNVDWTRNGCSSSVLCPRLGQCATSQFRKRKKRQRAPRMWIEHRMPNGFRFMNEIWINWGYAERMELVQWRMEHSHNGEKKLNSNKLFFCWKEAKRTYLLKLQWQLNQLIILP